MPASKTLKERMAVLETEQKNDRQAQVDHNALCSERYQGINDSFVRVHKRMDTQIKAVFGAVISSLLTLLGVAASIITYLVIYGPPWNQSPG